MMESSLGSSIAGRSGFLGIEYQHRYFWIQACRLFIERSAVRGVGLERPIVRVFDDVVTDYAVDQIDGHGRAISDDRAQLKFHVDFARDIRGADLADPKFINAKTFSLLDRLRRATRVGDIPSRLTLITPWGLADGDPIRSLVSGRYGEINITKLFASDASRAMRGLRETWRSELGGVDDERLAAILRHLEIRHSVPQWQLDDRLRDKLAIAGLSMVDGSKLVDPYLAISSAFIKNRTHVHDAGSLERVLRVEGLWGASQAVGDDAEPLAIKSFAPLAVHLEDEAATLDLTRFFAGRFTLPEVDWDGDLAPRIRDFLVTRVQDGGRYLLHFDAHLSAAYLAGHVLGKSGAEIVPVQRSVGRRIPWRRTGSVVAGPAWEVHEVSMGDGPEVAVAVEVTRAIEADVAQFLRAHRPAVGRVIVARIAGGVGPASVRDGDHAHALADEFVSLVDRRMSDDARGKPIHIFLAAPATLTFLLGREGRALGRSVLYEFDFDTRDPGAYSPSFHLPSSNKETR